MLLSSWKKVIPGLMALSFLFLACQQAAENKVLTPQEFQQQLAATPDALLLDVRTPGEVAKGVLDGATVINFRAPDFKEQLAQLPQDRPVFVYCAAGGRSGKTAALLKAQGFSVVYDLQGGITAWQAAGLPIVPKS